MRGAAGVTALVLAEAAVGTLAFTFLAPIWREVRRGFFVLTGSIVALLAAACWFSVRAGSVAGDAAGVWSARLAGALSLTTLAWIVLLLLRRPAPARALGLASVAVGLALLSAMAGTAEGSSAVAAFQLLAGAAFLGAVMAGLLLGHWYLTDRKLSRTPIRRYAVGLLGAVALEAAAVLAGGFGPSVDTASINPLLTSGGLASWIALGMVGTTALIAVLIHAALKGERSSAVQAATGFFYLAVITGMTAELAAKVRFLP